MVGVGSARRDVQAITQVADARAVHGFQARGGFDRSRLYRRAIRHSRFVRLVRVSIPLALVVGTGMFLAGMWLRTNLPIPVDLLKNAVVDGTRITMQQPRLSGFTNDGRPYDLSAQAAAQDLTKPDLLELKKLRAKIEMQDKAVVEITADSGLYETKSELLTLRQNVVLISSTGYEGYLSEAVIDMRAGKVVSEKPVHVKLLDGTLDGNRMEVLESGDLVRFDRGVVMHLRSLGGNRAGAATETQVGAAR